MSSYDDLDTTEKPIPELVKEEDVKMMKQEEIEPDSQKPTQALLDSCAEFFDFEQQTTKPEPDLEKQLLDDSECAAFRMIRMWKAASSLKYLEHHQQLETNLQTIKTHVAQMQNWLKTLKTRKCSSTDCIHPPAESGSLCFIHRFEAFLRKTFQNVKAPGATWVLHDDDFNNDFFAHIKPEFFSTFELQMEQRPLLPPGVIVTVTFTSETISCCFNAEAVVSIKL